MRESLILLPFAAAACTSIHPAPVPLTPPGRSALYVCADGREVQVLYGGDGAAALTVGPDTIVLTRDASAAVARYTGGGWIWVSIAATAGMLSQASGGAARASACHVR